MKKLTTSIFIFLAGNLISQCVQCTDMASALIQPEIVESLDLRAKGLKEFPREIGQFKHLKSLDLSDNFIMEIDFSSFELKELESFNLKNNPGFLALQLSNIEIALPNLKSLDFSKNRIKFLSPDIAKLKTLESLNLSKNSISYLPEEIDYMSNLKDLNISSNNLLAQDFMFSGMWKLRELNVANNDSLSLTKMFRSLLLKDDLKSLTISSKLFSSIPKDINELAIELLIIENSKNLKLPSAIRNNKNIRKIVFDNCSFADEKIVYDVLNAMPMLKVVEFKNMTLPSGLSTIQNLTELHLSDVQLVNNSELTKIPSKTKVYTENALASNVKSGNESSDRISQVIKVSEPMLTNDSPCIKDVEAQTKIIQSQESTEIILENTAFKIPENAFLNQDGTVYNGPVKIEVKEYMDPIINAISGMPMMYIDDGKANLFSSNGMIEFNANDQQGNALLPNPNNIIEVEMKDLQPSEASDLYVYNQNVQNWERIGAPLATNRDSIIAALTDSINRLTSNELVNTRTISPFVTMYIKTKRKDPSLFTFRFIETPEREKRYAPYNHFYTNDYAEEFIASKTWEVDSLLNDDLKKLFSDVRKSQKLALKYMRSGRKKIRRRGLPKPISNLKIVPDFQRDNYRLIFDFKGEEINLPVNQVISGNASKIQAKEAKTHQQYNLFCKRDENEKSKIKNKKTKYINKMAPVIRQQMITALSLPVVNSNWTALNEDRLRFGLANFGLVNCDYFYRKPPDDMLALRNQVLDQDSVVVTVPSVVNTILLDSKVFLSTLSSDIPFYKNQKSIIFFSINENEIAVLRTSKAAVNPKTKEYELDCQRINIASLSAIEIKKKMLEK